MREEGRGGGAVLHKMRSRWRQSHVVTWTGTLPLIHSLTWCLFVCVWEFTFGRKDLGGMLTEGLITVGSKMTVLKRPFPSFCEPVQWSSFFNGKYKIRAIRPRVWLRDLLFFLESTLVIVRLMVHQYCSRLSLASMCPRCVDLLSCCKSGSPNWHASSSKWVRNLTVAVCAFWQIFRWFNRDVRKAQGKYHRWK